jgi:PIN domain nuclease of toxin-antitoxin system
VIILDTHIWIWWTAGSSDLHPAKAELLNAHQSEGLAVSVISCWEIAKLVEKGRLRLSLQLDEWIDKALAHPGITLLPLQPAIAIASTRLPSPIHNDPADQIIIATARELGAD